MRTCVRVLGLIQSLSDFFKRIDETDKLVVHEASLPSDLECVLILTLGSPQVFHRAERNHQQVW